GVAGCVYDAFVGRNDPTRSLYMDAEPPVAQIGPRGYCCVAADSTVAPDLARNHTADASMGMRRCGGAWKA
ncbi:MAG TPA: hypothetical protein VFX03_03485, partial [Thermomicrobiales bacterium]|nr:hypothetical protein [Thermomicrobiales bacterium]